MPKRVRSGFLMVAVATLVIAVLIALAVPPLLRRRIAAGSEMKAPQAQQPLPVPPEVVWTWSTQCDGNHKLGVEVRAKRKLLYRGVLPICRGIRDAANGRVEFHAARSEYSADSTDAEGNIWQAGGEPDALILGISFQTKERILLNTLHIARPDKKTSSKLDQGLSIITYPLPER